MRNAGGHFGDLSGVREEVDAQGRMGGEDRQVPSLWCAHQGADWRAAGRARGGGCSGCDR